MARRIRLLPVVTVAATACAAAFQFRPIEPESRECTAPAWCVTGTVIDRSAGAPIPGAQIVVTRTACGAVADSTGHFRLTCTDTPGDTLVARGLGYGTLRRRVTIRPGQSYVALVRLDPVVTSPPGF